MVMGILILTGAYNTAELFRNNEYLRWIMGIILFVYGIFRVYNAIIKIKQGPRKLHYYDMDED